MHLVGAQDIVLDEEQGQSYTPSKQGKVLRRLVLRLLIHIEIHQYAKYLGMALPEDQDLLHIANEGLRA